MLASISRWSARILSMGFICLILVFWIGEGGFGKISNISLPEMFLMVFIPLLFTIGAIIAWKNELLGGCIILLSVLGFNLVDMIAWGNFFNGIEFGFLLIPGIFFIISDKVRSTK